MSSSRDIFLQDCFFSSIKVLHHAAVTPLTNILINLDLLSRDPVIAKCSTNSQHYLSKAIMSTKYLKSIMHQCNDNQIQRVWSFNIKESLLEIVQLCKNPTYKGHLIHFLQLNGKEILEGNKLYFQESIICLLNNAFQAYSQKTANKLVVLFASIEKNQLSLKVVDGATGFLLLNDSHNKIDPRNYSDIPKGTGLSFVEQVVTQHFSGKIKISSKLQKGTTIHCYIPLERKKQSPLTS